MPCRSAARAISSARRVLPIPPRPPDDQRRPRAFGELDEKQVRVGMEAAGRNAALARELGKREVRQGRRVEELSEGARGRRGVGVDRRQPSRKSAEPSVAQRRPPGENARKVLSAADLDDDSSQMIQPRMQLGDRLESRSISPFSRSTADSLAKVVLMQNQYAEMAR